MTPADIREDGFTGRGAALLRLLSDADPEVRSAAAVRAAELCLDESVALPALPALLAELARCDAVHPGVADAFFATGKYDLFGFTADDYELDVKAWMLGVLAARQGRRALSPVPGNDLEFHAHETFDDDPEALAALLDWGYVDTVIMALDHGVLPRAAMITLLEDLYRRTGRSDMLEYLAIGFGVLLADAAPAWPVVSLPGGQQAYLLTRDYAARRLWTVHWLIPHPAPASLPLAGDALLAVLIAAGLPLAVDEAALDATRIDHIGLPDIPQSRRHTVRPRRDLQLDLSVDAADRVLALRIGRARIPLELPGTC